jgi:hypothetical protein
VGAGILKRQGGPTSPAHLGKEGTAAQAAAAAAAATPKRTAIMIKSAWWSGRDETERRKKSRNGWREVEGEGNKKKNWIRKEGKKENENDKEAEKGKI